MSAASTANAQPETLFDAGRPRAMVVFSPDGGYAERSFLRRAAVAPDGWAAPGRTVAELLRRAPPGSGVRIAAADVSAPHVVDALMEATQARNVDVKLALAAPAGAPSVAALVSLAHTHLRARSLRAPTDAAWGDLQVKVGVTMHGGAFGIVGLSRDHAPGCNRVFLGDGGLAAGADVDRDGALLVIEDPLTARRAWQEFDALWAGAPDVATHLGGDPAAAKNATAEPAPEVLVDGVAVAGGPREPVQLVSAVHADLGQALADAIEAARDELPPGGVVWLSQVGLDEPRVVDALEALVKKRADVKVRLVLPMSWATHPTARRLATLEGEPIDVRFKWDPHTLTLVKGAPPQLPPPEKGPRPPTHLALLVGSQRLLMGTHRLAGPPDPHAVLADLRLQDAHPASDAVASAIQDMTTELEGLWLTPGVLMAASRLYGPTGLLETLAAASARPGFIETYQALTEQVVKFDDLQKQLKLAKPALRQHVDVLVKFDMAAWFGVGHQRLQRSPSYERRVVPDHARLRRGR